MIIWFYAAFFISSSQSTFYKAVWNYCTILTVGKHMETIRSGTKIT